MKKIFTTIIALVLMLGLSAQAQEPYISVQGQGQLEVMPSFVKMNLHLRAQDANAMAAKSKVDKAMNSILALTKKFSIEPSAIRAADLQRQPYYEWESNQRVLRGEEVSRSVQITLTQLDRYSEFLQGLIALDNVQIQQHELGFNDLPSVNREAMVLALQNAKQKATQMAAVLNNTLGKTLSIEEQGTHSAMPLMSMRMSAVADEQSPSPQIIQKQKISAQVLVRFELK